MIPARFTVLSLIFFGTPVLTAAPSFSEITQILGNKCVECHQGAKPAGNLDLTVTTTQKQALQTDDIWERVHEVLRGGTMPPDDNPPLTEDELQSFEHWYADSFLNVTTIVAGQSPLRRLTRREYQNSIEDLLNIQLHQELAKDGFRFMKPPPTIVEKLLPPDPPGGSGFRNDAAVLNLDQASLVKMLQIARYSVDQLDSFEDAQKYVFGNSADAILILKRFLTQAFRRQVEPGEINNYHQIYLKSKVRGDDHNTALKNALVAALTSPHFLYRFEQTSTTGNRYRVNDSELATRLSYFLWSSLPDQSLLAKGIKGELRQDEQVEAEIDRMLQSAKLLEFARNFGGQWLGFHEVISDQIISTGNNNVVKQRLAMYDEALLYFAYLVRQNRSIFEIIDSKESYINQMLAGLYGIKGFKPPVQTRLRGREDAPDPLIRWPHSDPNRGGYLTMAASMAITSAPQRTSPIRRGVWVLDKILGTPVPEPPAVVPPLEDARVPGKTLTVREQIELHTANESCRNCHQHIDPLGLGLENFGPLGRFRSNGIDATGTLPTGQSFQTPAELKRILVTEYSSEIRRNITERMLAYALGRRLRYYDKPVVDDLVKQLETGDDRFHVLIKAIANSIPFRYRPAATE
ncbi:MAG: DUF1588 domain-containing protein [Planctomycetota bacterium]|nr:DUF1588 domain-containing protein [Planctomycetota bacterium]